MRADNGIALAVASSGIAALLLEGGWTAHSRFKIPVNGINDLSTCYITKQSQEAELIQVTELIIWDEAPMQHKFNFQAVNRTFRDLTGIDKPFGGKIVVMGGDFRQVLPAIPRTDRAQLVDASLNRSLIWKFVHVITLHQNMRVQTMLQDGGVENAERQQQFSNWLKRIGDGTGTTYEQHGPNAIRIPDEMCIGCMPGDSMSLLLNEVYGELNGIQDWTNRAECISCTVPFQMAL
jgi:hypothetical protein